MITLNWFIWIIFGGLAGWVASMLTKRNGSMGIIKNVIVGIIGSWLGGFIMSFFGAAGVTGFNLRSFVVAVIGAVVLLGIFSLISKKS